METTISDDIRADAALYPVVRSANEVLLRAMERSRHPPRAVWRLFRDGPHSPIVELELFDPPDSMARQFAVEELADPWELHFKLTRLWGDLIIRAYQASSERMLDALRELRKVEEIREAVLQEN